jgi:hypothetical protein
MSEKTEQLTSPPPAEALTTINSPSLPTIPSDWNGKAQLVDACIGAGQRLTLWIAVLVAKARDDFEDPAEWLTACRERWGWEKSHCHHLRAVGAFLLKHRSRVFHGTLMNLDWHKLMSVSRLPDHLVAPFLAKVDVLDKPREQVREWVNAWLKAAGDPGSQIAAPAQPKGKTPARTVQGDFFDLLLAAGDEVINWTEWAAGLKGREGDEGQATSAAIAALNIIDAVGGKARRAQLPDIVEALREEADQLERLI